MKRLFQSKLLLITITAIIVGSIGVYAGTKINASDVKYIDSNNNEITVDTALNNLYTTQNTTVSTLESQLNTCNTKYSENKANYIIDSGHFISFTPIINNSRYMYFKINLSKDSNATCDMFIANVTSKQYDITTNTDYPTANTEGFSERRVYLSATNGWCIFTVTYHN